MQKLCLQTDGGGGGLTPEVLLSEAVQRADLREEELRCGSGLCFSRASCVPPTSGFVAFGYYICPPVPFPPGAHKAVPGVFLWVSSLEVLKHFKTFHCC